MVGEFMYFLDIFKFWDNDGALGGSLFNLLIIKMSVCSLIGE